MYRKEAESLAQQTMTLWIYFKNVLEMEYLLLQKP